MEEGWEEGRWLFVGFFWKFWIFLGNEGKAGFLLGGGLRCIGKFSGFWDIWRLGRVWVFWWW